MAGRNRKALKQAEFNRQAKIDRKNENKSKSLHGLTKSVKEKPVQNFKPLKDESTRTNGGNEYIYMASKPVKGAHFASENRFSLALLDRKVNEKPKGVYLGKSKTKKQAKSN